MVICLPKFVLNFGAKPVKEINSLKNSSGSFTNGGFELHKNLQLNLLKKVLL